jgi:hypothetical protein
MKFIKLFEQEHKETQKESHERFRNELFDFCEGYLAYLLDKDGVKLDTFDYHEIGIRITFTDPVHWSLIKDYIIPFYHYFGQAYYLKDSLLELDALDNDGDRHSRYYDMEKEEFRDWLGRETHHAYRGSINKVVIYGIKICLNRDRVYGKFNFDRLKK